MRVPPTERKGRVHTSTVTVAVFEGHLEPVRTAAIHPNDIRERITTGTGPGGQNRNRRATAIVLSHIPTGIEVKAEVERTQEGNRRVAMATLAQRVADFYANQAKQQVDQARRTMLGAGERSDKIRTYRPDGATDHRTNKRAPLKQVQAGQLALLWQD